MAGSTSFYWKKFCSETNPSGRFVWRENDAARPKTAEDRTDLLSCSERWRMPITPIMKMSVRGLVILLLSISRKKRSIDD